MVYTLGESLLDLIFSTADQIAARPGGSMLNAAVSLGRNNINVALISELGDDPTAQLIIDFLHENKVDTQFINRYKDQNTSVAVAFLNEQKIPHFSIHKSYPEKRILAKIPDFSNTDILMFGSIYSLDPAIRQNVVSILKNAKRNGAVICYDPNIRQHILDDKISRKALIENIGFADIIKGSDEDFKNLFGNIEAEGWYTEIRKINPKAVVVITLGEQGALGFYIKMEVKANAQPIKVVSTIGAGDAFNAGIAHFLAKEKFSLEKLSSISLQDFKSLMESGSRFATSVCQTMDNYVGKNFR